MLKLEGLKVGGGSMVSSRHWVIINEKNYVIDLN
jgi:hypothetical protein